MANRYSGVLEIPKGMLDELLVAADQLGLEDVVKIAEQKLRLVPHAAAGAPPLPATVCALLTQVRAHVHTRAHSTWRQIQCTRTSWRHTSLGCST